MKPDTWELGKATHGKLRVVYLRPSIAADEALAVGVVYDMGSGTQLHSVSAADAIRCVFGETVISNLYFSIQILRQSLVGRSHDIESLDSPVSNIFYGTCREFIADDPVGYVRNYLALASTFQSERKPNKSPGRISQNEIGRVLFDEASQIDVITATRIFEGYRVAMPRGKYLAFPIFGDSIIAAPVSMITRQIAIAKNTAEAFCAKLAIAKGVTKRRALLYVLLPSIENSSNVGLIEDSVGELEFVAAANDVVVRAEKNVHELARRILHDENG